MGMEGGPLRFAYLQWELKAEILTESKDQYFELIPIISDIFINFWRNGVCLKIRSEPIWLSN